MLLTSTNAPERTLTDAPTLAALLHRAFLVALLPGSIDQALTGDPQAAADLAIRFLVPAIEAARLDERARCARHLREHQMYAAANTIDPLGPLDGARAIGGTE